MKTKKIRSSKKNIFLYTYQAFTLIELLVVIVIIGILATISVAQFNRYQERARFAKAQAFASQVDTVLMATTTTTGYGFPLRLDFEEGSGTSSVDSSGSQNDAIWNPANVTWSNNTPDNSRHALDVITQHVSVPNAANLPTEEISVSGFIKIDNFANPHSYFLFILHNSGMKLLENGSLSFYINNENGNDTVTSATNSIQANRWHHLLGTYQDKLMRLYIDGNLVATKDNVTLNLPFNVSSQTMLEQTTFYVTGGGATGFDGKIDRVRIYPVGLNPNNL